MPFIVATYVYASSQGQRMHSARTNNLPKIMAYLSLLHWSHALHSDQQEKEDGQEEKEEQRKKGSIEMKEIHDNFQVDEWDLHDCLQ